MAIVGNAKNARLTIRPVYHFDWDSEDEWYLFSVSIRGQKYTFYRGNSYVNKNTMIARGATNLASTFYNLQSSDTIVIEAIDNALKIYRNGAILLSATDSTHLVAGDWDLTDGTLISFENLDPTYTVSYNANGGAGTVASQTGFTITLASSGFTRSGYTLVSWNTAADGSGTSYALGSQIALDVDTTLYAQWAINSPVSVSTSNYDAVNDAYTISCGEVAGISGYKFYYKRAIDDPWTLLNKTVQSEDGVKFIVHDHPPSGDIYYGISCVAGADESAITVAPLVTCPRVTAITSAKRVSSTQTQVFFNYEVAAAALDAGNWTVGDGLAISSVQKIDSGPINYSILITHAYQDELAGYSVTANSNVTGDWGDALTVSTQSLDALVREPVPVLEVLDWDSATDSIKVRFPERTALQHREGNGLWTSIQVSNTDTEYDLVNPSPDTHSFKIYTKGDFITTFDSLWSEVASTVPVMAQPTLVGSLSDDGENVVTLTASSSETVDSYEYYRGATKLNGNTDTLIEAGSYEYTVVAKRGKLSAAGSNTVTITAIAPTTPTMLKPTYSKDTNKVTLNWTDVDAEKGYQIEYYINNGSWEDIDPAILYEANKDETSYESTAFSDIAVYRVRSKNTIGVSDWSNYRAILTHPVTLALSNVESEVNSIAGKSLVNSSIGDIQAGDTEWSAKDLWSAAEYPDGIQETVTFEARLVGKVQGVEKTITDWTLLEERDTPGAGLSTAVLNFKDPGSYTGDALWIETRISAMGEVQATEKFLFEEDPISFGDGSITLSIHTQREDTVTTLIDPLYGEDVPFYLPITHGSIKYGSTLFNSTVTLDIPFIETPTLAGATYVPTEHKTNLIWSAVANAEEYSVEWGETIDGIFSGWSPLAKVVSSENTYTHTFEEDRRYQSQYRVTAIADGSMFKSSLASNTLSIDTKPVLLTDFQGAYDLVNDEVDLVLPVVNGVISYRVYYERSASKNVADPVTGANIEVLRKLIDLSDNSYTVPDAENGVVTFYVEALTRGGLSDLSPALDVDTRAPQPENLSSDYNLATNKITASVDAVEGATQYHWYHQDTQGIRRYLGATASPSYEMTNPRYGNNTFWVVAETPGGKGAYSEPAEADCTRTIKINSGRRLSLTSTEIVFNIAPIKAQVETISKWSLGDYAINSIAVQADPKVVIISHTETNMDSYSITVSDVFAALDEPMDSVYKTLVMPAMVPLIAPVWDQDVAAYDISNDRNVLRWVDPNPSGVTEYLIDRRVNGGSWERLATKAYGTLNHLDLRPPAGVIEYRIYANGNGQDIGWSDYSDPVVSITPSIPAPSLVAEPNESLGTIELSATLPGYSGLVFTFYRAEIIDNVEQAKVLLASSTDIITSANTFRYYATAKTANITSDFSEPAEIVPIIPDAPTLTSAYYSVVQGAIILSWEDVPNEFGYIIERNANLANPLGWMFIASVPVNSTSYQDINPSSNEVYNYRVQAIHPIYGNSAYSNIVSTTPSIPAPTLTATVNNSTGLVSLSATPPPGISIDAYSYFHEQNGVKIQIANMTGATATYQLSPESAGEHKFFVRGRHELVTSDYSMASTVTAQKPAAPSFTSVDSLYKENGYVKLTLNKLGDIYRWQNNIATKIATGVLSYTDLVPENQTGVFSYTSKSAETNHFGQSDHSTPATVTLTGTTPPLYFLTADNNEIFGFNQTLEERQLMVDLGQLSPDELYPEKLLALKNNSPGSFHVEVVVDGPNGRSVIGTSDAVTFNQSGEHFITCEVDLVKVQMGEALYAEFIPANQENIAPVRFRLMSEGNTYAASLWVFLLDIRIDIDEGMYSTVLCHGLKGVEQYNSNVRGIIPSPVPLPDPPVLEDTSNLAIQLGRVTINFSASPGATEYYLYRSKDGGEYQQRLQPTSSFKFVDTLGVESNSMYHVYSYYVKAKNSLGLSRESNIKTFVYQQPGKPTLESSAVSHIDGAFTLTMSSSSGGRATNYRVFKNGSLVSGGDINAASSIPPYTTYYQGNKIDGAIDTYSVVAYNGAGNSLSSDEISISNALPKPPTLAIQLNENSQQVDLTSGAVVLEATPGDERTAGYTFYKRKGIDGDWVKLNTTPQTLATYSDKITTSGDYYYAVAANNIIGESPKSESIRVDAPTPTDITFLASFSERTGWVTLTASGSYVNSYTFFRRDPSTGQTVNLGTNTEGLMLNAPPSIGQWVYYCSCLNMFGSTLSSEITTYVKWSGQLRAYQDGNEILFGIKSSPIKVQKIQTPVKVDFACTDKGKTSEDLIISTHPPFLVGLSTVGPWGQEANLGIVNSLGKSAYFYLPEAVDESEESPMVLGDMNDYSIIFDDAVGVPYAFTAIATGMSQIQLNWSKGFNAAGYEIWYKSSSFDWSLLREIDDENVLTYTATNLSSGTAYQFRLRSIGDQTYSDYTPEVSAETTRPDDVTPPLTTISGNSGLWVKSATLTLTGTDNLNGSGIDKTYYRIDNGVGQIYSNPVVVTTQGNVNFYYWSVDQAGNKETEKSVTLKIDSYGPIINIQPPEEVAGSKRVSAIITDPVSGVATSRYRVDGGSWVNGSSVLISTPGRHTVTFQATDNAGNASSQETSVTVGEVSSSWVPLFEESFDNLSSLPAALTRIPTSANSVGSSWGAVAALGTGLAGSAKAMTGAATGTLLNLDFYPKDKMRFSCRVKLSSITTGGALALSSVSSNGKLVTSNQRPFVTMPLGTTGQNPANAATTGYVFNEAKKMWIDAYGHPPLPVSSNALGVQYRHPGVAANYAAQLGGFGVINGRWAVASCRDYDRVGTVTQYGWIDIGAPLVELDREYLVELEFNGAALSTSFVGSDGQTYYEYFRMKITIDGNVYDPPHVAQAAGGAGPFLTYALGGATAPEITMPYPSEESPANGGYGGWMAGTWPGSGTRGFHRIPLAQSGATNFEVTVDDIKLEMEVTS